MNHPGVIEILGKTFEFVSALAPDVAAEAGVGLRPLIFVLNTEHEDESAGRCFTSIGSVPILCLKTIRSFYNIFKKCG